MVSSLLLSTAAAKGVTLLAGGLTVSHTVGPAQRTDDEGLWLVTTGGVLTGAGLVAGGFLVAVAGIDPAVSNTLAAVGLAVIVYSLFTDAPVPDRGSS
jgi:hypothetical protein